ncbi:unnamed protein product [Rhodiola kirilowii]
MNNSRGRYPLGMGEGGRGGGGFNGNNGSYQPRNPRQYVQRNVGQNYQQQQNSFQQQQQQNTFQQQQQWMRRDQIGHDSGVVEVEKTVQSEGVDSSTQDWKA